MPPDKALVWRHGQHRLGQVEKQELDSSNLMGLLAFAGFQSVFTLWIQTFCHNMQYVMLAAPGSNQ